MDNIVENSETNINNLPRHVPAALVWDNNLTDYAKELDDPYIAVARLHDGPDIIWSNPYPYGRSGWVLTRFALIQEAFLDHARFSTSDASEVGEILGVEWKLNPLEYDPPVHIHYRKILNPWFTPNAVNDLDATVRKVCQTLFNAFEERGSCEFISEFASPFPAYIFLELMGMPASQLEQFLEWERDWMQYEDPAARLTAARDILRYLESYMAERRAHPQSGLGSAILQAQFNGRLLDDNEVMGMLYVLYVGGLDTVMSSLGWAMRHLVNDLPLQNRLRENPEEIPRAIEEILRAHGVTATRRTATHDFEFHGVAFKKGDLVFLPTYLAGRDEREYPNPHIVDIDRKMRHITFGTGAHNCLGIHLARREMRIVIEEFLAHFKNLRVLEGEKINVRIDQVWGVDRLPLTWDKP